MQVIKSVGLIFDKPVREKYTLLILQIMSIRMK